MTDGGAAGDALSRARSLWGSVPCSDEHCIICGDSGRPGRIAAVDAGMGLATVLVDGELTEVDVTLIGSVSPGDVLLIHAGVAIALLDDHD